MNYTVIGAARSGLAAALLAKKKGHNVFLTESKDKESFMEAAGILAEAGIESEFYGNTERALENCDCIITSPGVPPTAWIIAEAENRNIPIIGELEFARSYCPDNPLIAITGTNGKTTTTTLTAYILNKSGRKAIAVGNIGTPLAAVADELSPDTIIVAEVSSFQLDRIKDFRPDVAMILNITPDHLAYHGSFDKYSEAKFKISVNQNEKNLLILNGDDKATFGGKENTKAKVAYFTISPDTAKTKIDWGIYGRDGKLIIRMPVAASGSPEQQAEEEIMLLDEIRLPGVHNVYNSMAAAIAARAFEITNENIRDSLMAFEGVEHRLEFVASIDGVDFVNDSKATNVNATWYALSSFKKPLVWIAGGRGDSNNYSMLDELVEENVKCIIAIGEEADAIFNHYCTKVRCIKADSLDDAVYAAKEQAEADEIVLFTPACKSFDMFMNYEHRGEVFKQIVKSMY